MCVCVCVWKGGWVCVCIILYLFSEWSARAPCLLLSYWEDCAPDPQLLTASWLESR